MCELVDKKSFLLCNDVLLCAIDCFHVGLHVTQLFSFFENNQNITNKYEEKITLNKHMNVNIYRTFPI